MNDKETIPTVDLLAFINGTDEEREIIAHDVDEICRTIGFLIIKNHNVPKEISHAAWAAAKEFFDQSSEEKNKARSDDKNSPRGYSPIEGETLSKTLGLETPPDRKESFSTGPITPPKEHAWNDDFHFFYGPNIWPDKPSEFKNNWCSYYNEMEKLGAQLMELFAAALNVENDYFVNYHTHHISALRSQNYPSLTKNSLSGQLRAGEHTDYGTVTILNPDPLVSGLEVKLTSGNWVKAPILLDAFIINIGDMMARWTNDRWVSTLHRVVDPITNNTEQPPCRQSIAYFMNPNYDSEIKAIPTCIKTGEQARHTPVLAGQYLMDKFKTSM